MSEPRSNAVILIVGTRDVGKTTFIKELIMSANFPKKLVVDEFDSRVWQNMKTFNHPEWESIKIPRILPNQLQYWQSGLYRAYDSDIEMLQREVVGKVENTFVVMEDATRYFDMVLTKDQKRLVLNTKQNNCDLVLAFHSIADIPPRLVKYSNYLTLMKTDEDVYDKNKITHPQFRAMFERVKHSKDRHYSETIKLK